MERNDEVLSEERLAADLPHLGAGLTKNLVDDVGLVATEHELLPEELEVLRGASG